MINVTKSYLPPFEHYAAILKRSWDKSWITNNGELVQELELRLKEYLNVNQLHFTSNGTVVLQIALKALGITQDVITTPFSYVATTNAILWEGCQPVFVDIDPSTCCIDAHKIEAAIGPKTKAIMLAHTLGNPFNLSVVRQLCEKYGLWLVEDCCDALGATYADKNVGTFGDLSTLSFYPAHHITMGEGGTVMGSNKQLMTIAESFRDWGRDCYCAPGKDNTCQMRFCQKLGDLPEGYDHKYIYSHLGYNLKITDMQAACGLAQLQKAPGFIEQRRQNFAFLKSRLATCEEFLLLPEATANSNPSWFGFPLTLKANTPISRVDLLQRLDAHKIGTRLLFAGNLVRQPYMKGREFRISGELTNTDTVMRDTFWIGVQPALSQEMLEYSVRVIEDALGVRPLVS